MKNPILPADAHSVALYYEQVIASPGISLRASGRVLYSQEVWL